MILSDSDICVLVLKYNIPSDIIKAVCENLLELISADNRTRGNARTTLRKALYGADRTMRIHSGERRKYKGREYIDTIVYYETTQGHKYFKISNIISYAEAL